jgi:hypothetical protein
MNVTRYGGMMVMALLLAVTAASAQEKGAVGFSSAGDYGKVSWTATVDGQPLAGYLYAARQPKGDVYVYYWIQISTAAPVTGYGTVGGGSLRRTNDGRLLLSVTVRQMAKWSIQGASPGPIGVTWTPLTTALTAQSGASATNFGAITQTAVGETTSAAARAVGNVTAWSVTLQQAAELGTTNTTNLITVGP